MNQPIKSKKITAFTFSEKKKHFLENLETMDITIKIFGKQLNLALQLQIQIVVTKLYLSKKMTQFQVAKMPKHVIIFL